MPIVISCTQTSLVCPHKLDLGTKFNEFYLILQEDIYIVIEDS